MTCPECPHVLDRHTTSVELYVDDPYVRLQMDERGEYPVTCSECDCTYEEGQQ